MYGVTVGARSPAHCPRRAADDSNVAHDAAGFANQHSAYSWTKPDVSRWLNRTFAGYHRADGQVGTRNYWLVVPLVFCENRNVDALREAFEEELGYGRPRLYRSGFASSFANIVPPNRIRTSQPAKHRSSQGAPFPTSTELSFSFTRAAAEEHARIQERSAACLRATSTIPTLPAQPY